MSPSPPTSPPPPSRRWFWLKRLALLVLLLAIACAAALVLVLRHYDTDLPSTAELKNYHPPQVTRVVARDGTLLAELFVERRTVVPIEGIPHVMQAAALAAEDADFYLHEGLDYFGMLRALLVNIRAGSAKQGGSTITQQVVKNVLLTPARTFERKARELLLARRIEQELSKDEILELYLNHIYFGHGRYGVEEASRYYFGKPINAISLAEAAVLAGLVKGPEIYSPRRNYARSLKRRNHVLDQLAAKQFADKNTVALAKVQPIVLAPAPESLDELAPEAVAEAKRMLKKLVGRDAARGGYTITTSIDPQLQAAARRAVRGNLDQYAKRHRLLGPLPDKVAKGTKLFAGTPSHRRHQVYQALVTGADDPQGKLAILVGSTEGSVSLRGKERYNPKNLPPSQFAAKGTVLRVSAIAEQDIDAEGIPHAYRLELGPQSALVAIETKSRQIRALVGSYRAVRGQLDRASFAHRQPGSTFKPIVYGYGIVTRRLTPATIIPEPARAPESEARPALLLRPALARSVNRAATWALSEVGPEAVVQWARAVGISSPLRPTKSLALGAYEVTPRELAGAYATIASGGLARQAVLVTKIVDSDGNEVPLPPRPPQRRVMDEAEAYLLSDLLTSVVREGTGRKARVLGFTVAGKTGTSNDARDGWFAGFSSQFVCVVWTGYDDNLPLGKRESGATAALPAFVDFMREAHPSKGTPAFTRPDGLVRIAIDPKSGLRAYPEQEDAVQEIFLAGTEPTEIAEPPPDEGAGGAGGGGAGGAGSDISGTAGGGGRPADASNPAGGAEARPGAQPQGAGGSESTPSSIGSAQPDAPPPF